MRLTRWASILCIAVLILAAGISQAAVAKYSEAPALAGLVKQGLLPPVDERLPKNPLVVTPIDSIGQYGGTLVRAATNVIDVPIILFGYEPLVRLDRDGKEIIPNLVESWDIEDEGKTFVFHLREGIKWSDGAPLTAEDFTFWYEDVICNKDLTPAYPSWLKVGDERATYKEIDTYTMSFTFNKPYGLFLEHLASPDVAAWMVCYPKHYMKQFHPNYADPGDLQAEIKAGMYDTWYQLFGQKATPWSNPDLPSIRPWLLSSDPTATRLIEERNPYYWKVDPEGNQLPYIDRHARDYVQDAQMLTMKAVSGELGWIDLPFNEYPLLKENSEKAGYDVRLWDANGSAPAISPNHSYEDDPVLGELLRDIRFKKALSLSIKRDEINELVFFGLATEAHTLNPVPALREDAEIAKLYEYDLAEANRLLDEMGLDRRDRDGFRLRPDGEPIALTLLCWLDHPTDVEISELLCRQWEAIGIKGAVDPVSHSLWWPRVQSNSYHLIVKDLEFTPESFLTTYSMLSIASCRSDAAYMGPLWGVWYVTGGEEGVEPEDAMKRMLRNYDEMHLTIDQDRSDALLEEICRLWAENLYVIPILGGQQAALVTDIALRNVPEYCTLNYAYSSPGQLNPEQFYFEEK